MTEEGGRGGQAFLNFDFFLKNSQKFSDFHSKRGVGKALLYEKKLQVTEPRGGRGGIREVQSITELYEIFFI